MKLIKPSIPIGMCILLLSILACTVNVGGPAYPTPAIPISTEAMGQLNATMEAAVSAGAGSGQVTLVINEEQLTSYLAYQLQSQTQPIITNPQVYLQDGQIRLYGTARQGYFEATASIILTAGIDQQGQLKIDLTSADFGPLPVPNGLLDVITGMVKEAYTGALGPVATGFRLTSIEIGNGTMTIVGQIK